MEKHDAIIENRNISWLQAGNRSNPVMFLIHGFPDGPGVWQHQIDRFRKDHFVICPFLPGSTGQPGDRIHDVNTTVFDWMTLIESLSNRRGKTMTIVGHDIGSAFAWRFAELFADRVKTLIIVNGGHPVDHLKRLTHNKKQMIKSWYLPVFGLTYIPETFFKLLPLQGMTWLREQMGYPKNQKHLYDSLGYADHLVGQYKKLIWFCVKELFTNNEPLNIKLVHIAAKSDHFIEPPQREELAARVMSHHIALLPGKHWIQLENPEAVNKIIADSIKPKRRSRSKKKAHA